MAMAKGQSTRRIVIMGAAGRDFHDVNMVFRGDAGVRVVAFAAALPDIFPIHPEEDLDALVELQARSRAGSITSSPVTR